MIFGCIEHGSLLGGLTNITNNNLIITAKIATAHLVEDPQYYQRLKKMELSAEKYWEKKKPNIFL